MTGEGLLEHIFDRLGHAESAQVIFGVDEVAEWPDGALNALITAGLFKPAQPAQVIACDGCERNCFMPVHVRPAEDGRAACALIACDKPEDVGRIPVEFRRLEQWRITTRTLAGAVTRLLSLTKPSNDDGTGTRWALGLLTGKKFKGVVTLLVADVVTLEVAGQSIPLAHALTINRRGVQADRNTLLRLAEGATQQPASGVGSVEWRKRTAKAAADARHSKAGGSREKQDRMRAAWATGKYTTRDRCAEEECAALDMSFSAARKALRNN